MKDFTKYQPHNAAISDVYDAGLRKYMVNVYNYMAGALALSGVVAYMMANSESLMQLIWGSPLKWVAMFAPLAMVMLLSFKINSLSFSAARTMFWSYAALMGVSLSTILMIYTGQSVARTFFISASLFASMSLYGYTTKKDLTGVGSFLIMGFWGIFIASMVNIFLQSSMVHLVTSALGVLIFTGLTAYNTQRIREQYSYFKGTEMESKSALMGALNLYVDFINLFISLLRFVGDRR